MRIKSLELVCPKCKKSPKIIKYEPKAWFLPTRVEMKCNCSSVNYSFLDKIYFEDILSQWIASMGKKGAFDDYNSIIKKGDLTP